MILIAIWCAQRIALLGAGAGVDSAWEQRKLEARKMLANAARPKDSPTRQVRALLGAVEFAKHCLWKIYERQNNHH